MYPRSTLTFLLIILPSLVLMGQDLQKVIRDADLATGSYQWSADTTYLLDGYVFLESGGQLNIPPGTTIRAKTSPSTGDLTSALVIARGAQLIAEGTPIEPIIFTAESDDLSDPADLTHEDRGLWGGLIILGAAPVKDTIDASIITSHHVFPNTEERASYGGEDLMSSSGRLQCVSVRFAGANTGASQFAGISLAGVGSGTSFDSIEVHASAGDGFEFIGGNVDSKNLASSFNGDDCFDWSMGFVGRGQFWFGLQGDDLADCAFEGRDPFSNPVIYNFTLIGSGANSAAQNPLAIRLSDGSGGQFGMGIITDFPRKGIEVEDLPGDDDSYAKISSGDVAFKANIFSDFGRALIFDAIDGLIATTAESEDPLAEVLRLHLEDSNYLEEEYLPFISRKQNQFLYPDDRIDGSDPNYPSSYPSDEFFIRSLGIICSGPGAFMTDGAWWLRYWTHLDQNKYLMHPCAADFYFYQPQRLNQDTFIISCENIDLQDYYYLCRNSFCGTAMQTLAVAMRSKRKKKKSLEIDLQTRCYVQELVYEGVETWIDERNLQVFVLDTFEFTLTALVTDSIPPQLILAPCDTCAAGIAAFTVDCDSAWIADFDSMQINAAVTQYTWTGADRCGNESTLQVERDQNAAQEIWYQDLDGDGFGNEEIWLAWKGHLPGYSLTPGDCNDADENINPGVIENPLDNIDNSCSGASNIEVCFQSDALLVQDSCQFQDFQIHPSSLEANSYAACIGLADYFDGDVWFTISAPLNGRLRLEISADLYLYNMQLYRGGCDGLETIECTQERVIESDALVPEELLYLQIVLGRQSSGTLSLCASTDQSTDVDDQGISPIRVFPNPTSGNFQVLLDDHEKVKKILLTNLVGQVVREWNPSQDEIASGLIEINLSNQPAGPYFLRVKTAKGTGTAKILKW